MGFCHFSKPQSENEIKGKDKQIPRSCQRDEKAVENKRGGDTYCSWSTRNSSQRFEKGIGKAEIKGSIKTILTIAMLKSAPKNPRKLKRFAVIYTSVKNRHYIYIYIYIYIQRDRETERETEIDR